MDHQLELPIFVAHCWNWSLLNAWQYQLEETLWLKLHHQLE